MVVAVEVTRLKLIGESIRGSESPHVACYFFNNLLEVAAHVFAWGSDERCVKFRETIQIEAPPEVVWNFVSDPEAWPRWNPRVKQIRRDRRGPLVETEQFTGIFQLSGEPKEHSVEIARLDSPRSLVMRQRYEWRGSPCELMVLISVEPLPTGSRVTTVIDYSRTGIPWPLRLLLWWITRSGRKVGSSPLDTLKRLAEQVPASKAA